MWYVLICANYCCFGLQAVRRRSLCAGCANYQPPFFCLGFPSLYLPCGEWKETLDPWWAVVAMQGGERQGPKISHCITADALRTTVWGDYWFACCCSRDAMFTKTCRITLQTLVLLVQIRYTSILQMQSFLPLSCEQEAEEKTRVNKEKI